MWTQAPWGLSNCLSGVQRLVLGPHPSHGTAGAGREQARTVSSYILQPALLAARHKAGLHPGGESEHDQPQRVMVFQHFNYKAVGENSPPDVQQEIELHKHGRHIPAQLP